MAMACVLSVCLLTSCVYDDEPETPNNSDSISFLNIALSVPLADNVNPNSRANGGYQDGDKYENYIDIDRYNYRIFFFDEQNKLIARFAPIGFSVVEGSEYSKYEIYGITPKEVEALSSFKVMITANWLNHYDSYTIGKTTIDDICNNFASTFRCLTNQELNPSESRLIPMYGIHRYENVTFTKGETTTLAEPITMLRAMAKVEVILDTEQDIEISDVSLRGYNERGYCAPQGVYSEADYGQGLDWENDYLHRLHLVGGANDQNATSRQLAFRCLNKKTTNKKETWIAYIPEYRNVAADGTAATDEAYIELHLNIQTADEKPFCIYFAEYGSSGTTQTSEAADLKRIDIERNNIYRFTVSLADNKMEIYVRQWNPRPQPPIIL